eukprot:TRINITY_DN74777_c0_g1_i1.p1 TRINITY_DN74777_c0_g1~~TRINITY_DN74777_c0_g1_i1.p1  ORF type:complete len:160 (+),score=34.72 TRINITY_DN74777_c0_g1_i1:14-493(+)
MAAIVDVEPPPTEGPFPGESPETMDDLRQECATLRQQVVGLEAENAELQMMVREWRRWYAQSYKPQMEFLDAEIGRLVGMAPPGKRLSSPPPPPNGGTPAAGGDPMRKTMSSTTGGSPWQPPAMSAPPGMRRQGSGAGLHRKMVKQGRTGGGATELPPV